MSRIICIGSATKDIFFPTKEGLIMETPEDIMAQKKIAFELGAKYHIAKRYETLGGCAVNVAVGISRLGLEVACYVPVGDDVSGTWIVQEIAKENVNVEKIDKIENSASDLSAIIVDAKSGERTIFSNHDASQKFKVNEEKIGDEEWIFVGDLSGNWKQNMKTVFEKAAKQEKKIAFNPRQQMLHDDISQVIEMLGSCEILFVNKDEAIEIVQGMENVTNEINEETHLLKALKRTGCGIVVLTNGVQGAWVFDGKEIFYAGAFLQEAVDTTGSGDAFASGFLGAFLQGKNIEESLVWGIANSSSSVKEYGGQKGLLNQSQIEEITKEISVEKIV